jgi:hypothetical protein
VSAVRRRSFLGTVGAAGLATVLGGRSSWASPSRRKLIIVQFGGGARNSETIDDPTHSFIPRLWRELVPRGALFTNMRVEGAVVHPNSTASIVTGHWEYADLDWTRPPVHATVFERYRRATAAPDTATWAFVYASILAKTGESLAPAFGPAYGANLVEPPTVPRATAEQVDAWLAALGEKGSLEQRRAVLRRGVELVRRTSRFNLEGLRSAQARAFARERIAAWYRSSGSTHHDRFLAESAVACMRRFAPDVLAVCFGDMDCAHFGSWSAYTEAIRLTDELTALLCHEAESLPAYRGRTLIAILPDHGRELERADGLGYVHHSDFYTRTGEDEGCRRVFMLLLGPGVPPGRIDAPVPITAVAATGLEFLGVDGPSDGARSVLGVACA